MAEAEVVLVTALSSGLSARVVTELPATLPAEIVRVTQFGGTDDREFSIYEEPILDFDCFAATRQAARTLAYSVRHYVREVMPGTTVGTDAFIVWARTVSGPRWTPYDNTDVRRFTYTAQLRIHSL